MKKSFVLYLDQYEVIKKLSKDQKSELLDMMFLYNLGGGYKTKDHLLDIIFTVFQTTFDRDTEKWKNKAEANKQNGKKGGRPKKNNNSDLDNNPKNPDGSEITHGNPQEPKKAVSGSGSVNVSVMLVGVLLKHFNKKTEENNLKNNIGKLAEFIEYRSAIKKPLKSKQGITGILNISKKLKDTKLDVDKCLDYTMEKEWLSPPIDFFMENKKDFKASMEVILLCMDSNLYSNSKYQDGGLWKTSDVEYVNMMPNFIDDNEWDEVNKNNDKFIAEFCEGVD